jgi:hypothetical protein
MCDFYLGKEGAGVSAHDIAVRANRCILFQTKFTIPGSNCLYVILWHGFYVVVNTFN